MLQFTAIHLKAQFTITILMGQIQSVDVSLAVNHFNHFIVHNERKKTFFIIANKAKGKGICVCA